MNAQIRRRDFITLLGGAVLTSPLALRQAAHAAPPGRSVTIGVIAPLSFPALEGLRRGFRELGYVEGRNLQLEYRWAEGSTNRYFNVAQELVGLGVDDGQLSTRLRPRHGQLRLEGDDACTSTSATPH